MRENLETQPFETAAFDLASGSTSMDCTA